MAVINVLDKDTVNLIAAGEVVERPASVVKELLENAIDAKATAITVEIKGGGIDFIRITDNGCGIEESEIRKAFMSHATSKIQNAEDILTVSSLGFRGEALPSIAAVADVEVITKTDLGISGVRYVIEGGEERSFTQIGCPEGTTFLVRNLFSHTPARRKFLKSAMTEAGYVEAYVERLALSHPEISIKYINENKNKISTSGNGNLKDVIYNIFGRDIANHLLEVSHEENGVKVKGFIGKPVISRGNRNFENYFVNGRYLKNAMIMHGIEDGYKGHAMVHKFPFTVLMIEMDPMLFDVNVHPAKLEMRFENGEHLYTAVLNAVKASFVKKELIPEARIENQPVRRQTEKVSIPEPFEIRRKESMVPVKEARKSYDPVSLPEKKVSQKTVDNPMETNPFKRFVSKNDQKPSEKPRQMSFEDIPVLAKEARPGHRLIGQVFATYWLMEYEEKLYFVDQHAAHEKVMYEKIRKEMEAHAVTRQMVAPPIIVSLTTVEKEKFLKCRKAFETLGFEIEEFGGNEYAITAVPANLLSIDQKDLFLEVLDGIDDSTSRLDLSILTDRMATMACKAAIKGNTKVSEAEMDHLMDQLLELDNPYQCPHGRPTMIAMSKRELEKKFKRIQ